MKKFTKIVLRSLSILSLGIVFIFCSCDTDESQTVAQLTNLVMADEFSTDGAPNSSMWNFEIGTGTNGWGNNELQYYTDRTENVKVENGFLLLNARQEAFGGSNYTSARITSQNKFEQQYGRFEARMRLPHGQGLWPAFWLLGNDCGANIWPNCGEIDIMEFRGQQPTVVHGSVHGPGYSAGNAVTKSYTLQDSRFDTEFHVFGIEWTPDYVNYYVDGDLYQQITKDDVPGQWVFDHPFYIIINLAVGGSFVGSPNADTSFPQTMLVDYVRVYQ